MMYTILLIVCLSFSTPSCFLVNRLSRFVGVIYFQDIHFRMIRTNHIKIVFNKHTAFVLAVNGVRLPITMSSILWVLITNDDGDTKTHCAVIRDSASVHEGTQITWSWITIIFR